VGENPFLAVGQRLQGHEFHYAKVETADDLTMAYSLERGHGMGQKRDGIVHKNVLAGFTHLHALSEPTWAEGLVNPTRSRETGRKSTAPAAHSGTDALQP
jgi:cobyrinic acid a,c-diamide synthase